MSDQELRLDITLYIGIAVDVVLAIIAGVLIHSWRKQRRERDEDRRRVDGVYGVSQRTEREMIPMDSRSVSRAGEPDTDRENQNMKPGYTTQTSERGSNKHESEAVRTYDNNPTIGAPSVRYPQPTDDTMIHNPLYESRPGVEVREEGPDTTQGEEVTLSTYYTYSPPEKQLDDESSEVHSQPEIQPVSAEVDRYLDLIDKESDPGSMPTTPEPVPHSGSEGHVYTYIDAESVTAERGDKTSMRSGSTINFNEEPVSKLYSIDVDESTQIM